DGGGTSGLLGGTPPAWRALDRLSAAARDWEQIQQPLPPDDVQVLMDHRLEVIERVNVDDEERPPFYLLFIRDAEDPRNTLCEAAKECFVYSAVAHDLHGRWAFKEIFRDIDDRLKRCDRWLKKRIPAGGRVQVLRHVIEFD